MVNTNGRTVWQPGIVNKEMYRKIISLCVCVSFPLNVVVMSARHIFSKKHQLFNNQQPWDNHMENNVRKQSGSVRYVFLKKHQLFKSVVE